MVSSAPSKVKRATVGTLSVPFPVLPVATIRFPWSAMSLRFPPVPIAWFVTPPVPKVGSSVPFAR